jgi:hypothetical protein
LYGDIFGGATAKVNNSDLTQFNSAYLQTNGASTYQAGFDFFGTGHVNNPDLTQFNGAYLAVWSGFSATI